MAPRIPKGSMQAFYQQTAGPAVELKQQADPDRVVQLAQQHLEQTIPLRRVNAFTTRNLQEDSRNLKTNSRVKKIYCRKNSKCP